MRRRRINPGPSRAGGRSIIAVSSATEAEAPVLAKFRAGHRGVCTAHVLFAALLGKFAEPATALRVLATVRAQHLVAVAQLPGLAAAIGPAIFLLLEPRDEHALRDIIVEPARLGGRDLDEPTARSLLGAAARGELRLGELESRLAALWDAPPAP